MLTFINYTHVSNSHSHTKYDDIFIKPAIQETAASITALYLPQNQLAAHSLF